MRTPTHSEPPSDCLSLSAAHKAKHYARTSASTFARQLQQFIRIPSVSADPRHAADVRRCAAWLARHLREIGLRRVRLFPTPGHPIVYADWLRLPGRPSLLIYGHYDVQPADPLHEWRTPPFAAAIIADRLIGRGASDDKGQLFAHLKAIHSWLATAGSLPLNIKCLFEGEEEIGSPHLIDFLRRNRNALAADAAVISDTEILGPDRPAIAISVRGALALGLTVTGQASDLHSGNLGGALHNPLQALCEIIAALHDRAGRIAIPGFYDAVLPQSASSRRYMSETGPADADILARAGTRIAWGEPGYSLRERITIRPALTINGLAGGYVGPGHKAVIPRGASAILGFRLVPAQHPDDIERFTRRHIARIAPRSVTVRLKHLMAALPSQIDPRHSAVRAAAAACKEAFGRPPVFTRIGGSIPVVEEIQRNLGVTPVLMGFALPDSAIHAPDENLHLPTFRRSVDACIEFLRQFSRISLPSSVQFARRGCLARAGGLR